MPIEVPVFKRGLQVATALVDDDLAFVLRWRWVLHCKGYVVRTTRGAGGKKKSIYLHRLVMEFPEGKQVDHKDTDKFNNQRYNLEAVTLKINIQRRDERRRTKTSPQELPV